MRWESPSVELELPLSCQLEVFAAVGMSFRCSYVPIGLVVYSLSFYILCSVHLLNSCYKLQKQNSTHPHCYQTRQDD